MKKSFVVTGSGSGLGQAIADRLLSAGHQVWLFDKAAGHDVRAPASTWGPCPEELDGLINCAGINRTEWIEHMTEELWREVMDTNSLGLLKMSQWALKALERTGGTILNVVSDAAHKPMTTSIAYNASKGAAHIMTLQMAHELYPRHGILVWGVAPNKLRGTGMSRDIESQVTRMRGWTPEFAAEYQRKSLARGEETEPEDLAEFIAWAMAERRRHRNFHKLIIPFGA